jgi:hypothetical protein
MQSQKFAKPKPKPRPTASAPPPRKIDYTEESVIKQLQSQASTTVDPERQMTIAMIAKHTLRELQERQAAVAGPIRQQKLDAYAALMEYMKSNDVDCLETGGSAVGSPVNFVRLCQRTTTGRALTCKMIADVLETLTPDVCERTCCTVSRDAEAAEKAWRAKREKELRREVRAEVATGGRKRARDTAADIAERVRRKLDAEQPPQHECVMRGKGKACPSRAPLVGVRPSMRQLVSSTLYQAIHGAHKVIRPVLVLDSTPGRSTPVAAAACPAAVATAADTFCSATAKYARAVAAIAKPRRMLRQVLATCEPVLQKYVVDVSPADRLVRRLAPPDVHASGGPGGTFKVQVRSGRKWNKPLTMWDVSRVVDAAVDALAASMHADERRSFEQPPRAPREVADWLATSRVREQLLTEIEAQLTALRSEREVEYERVSIHSSLSGVGGVGGGVDDSDTDEDEDEDADADAFPPYTSYARGTATTTASSGFRTGSGSGSGSGSVSGGPKSTPSAGASSSAGAGSGSGLKTALRSADSSRERSRDGVRARESSRESSREHARDRDHVRERERSRDHVRERERSRDHERSRDRERDHGDRDRDRDRDRRR